MIPRPIQHLLLATLYDAFEQWASTFTFACAASGVAEMPPGYLAGATVLLQYIEHLDHGGRSSTMVELLAGLNTGQVDAYGEPTAPIPGFLIAPDEHSLVEPLLQELLARTVNGQTFSQWLQAARP